MSSRISSPLFSLPAESTAVRRYGAALLFTAAAGALTLVLTPVLDRTLFIFFFASVALSAFVGGFGPGLLATILAIAIVNYLFIGPTHSFALGATIDVVHLSIFAAIAALISSLSGRSRRARRIAEERASELATAADQLQSAARRTAESEARYRALVEATTQMVWTANAEGADLELPEWPRITGQSREQSRGTGWLDAVHPDDRAATEQRWRDAIASRAVYESDHRVRLRDGSYRWYRARGVPVTDATGQIVEWIGALDDVDRARREADSRAFLAAASEAFAAEVRDHRLMIDVLARLAVEFLADACVVHLVDDEGGVERAAVAARHPSHRELIARIEREHPAATDATTGHLHVIRSGESQLASDQDLPSVPTGTSETSEERLSHEIDVYSTMAAPLTARGRTLGAMTLILCGPHHSRPFDRQDLAFAEDLARRAAIAVDNALLYAKEQRARTEAEGARATAERASRAKSEFLAVMSHELRTPLNAIMGYTELIAEGIVGTVNDTQRGQLARIRASALHLLGLIDEILTLSRLEADREQIRAETVDLFALVRDAAAMMEPQVLARGLTFRVDVPPSESSGRTDATKLRQIVLNLLSNAVKFTDEGEIAIRARRDDDCLTITVQDTGIGVSPSHVERIFEPFWQVEQSTTRRAGGTGLGLTVTRQLARLLGGDVTVRSTQGVGSAFEVEIDVASGE